MKIQQLACFIEVARTKNFTIASNNLFLSQPSISYNIRELERELGVALFSRGFNSSSVDITPQGEAFLEVASEILALHNECGTLFESIRQEAKSTIPIVCSESILYNIIPELVKYTSSELSTVSPASLKIFSAYSIKDVERVIESEMAEFALYSELPSENMNYTEVINSHLLAFVPASSPVSRNKTVTLAELADMPLALPSDDDVSLNRYIQKMFEHEAIKPTLFTCRGQLLQDRLANVSLGQCYTISTDWHVNSRFIAKIPIDNSYNNIPIYAIWKKNRILSDITSRLIKYCKNI